MTSSVPYQRNCSTPQRPTEIPTTIPFVTANYSFSLPKVRRRNDKLTPPPPVEATTIAERRQRQDHFSPQLLPAASTTERLPGDTSAKEMTKRSRSTRHCLLLYPLPPRNSPMHLSRLHQPKKNSKSRRNSKGESFENGRA